MVFVKIIYKTEIYFHNTPLAMTMPMIMIGCSCFKQFKSRVKRNWEVFYNITILVFTLSNILTINFIITFRREENFKGTKKILNRNSAEILIKYVKVLLLAANGVYLDISWELYTRIYRPQRQIVYYNHIFLLYLKIKIQFYDLLSGIPK